MSRSTGARSMTLALALASLAACVGQIGLGILAIWSFLGVAWVTSHLAGAVLLLSLLIVLRMRLARVPASVAAPCTGTIAPAELV